MDHDALAAVGIGAAFNAPPIPIDEPIKFSSQAAAFKAAVRDRLPMTPVAKKALEKSSKEIRRGHQIGPQQVLLTVLELEPPDPAAELSPPWTSIARRRGNVSAWDAPQRRQTGTEQRGKASR